MERQLLQTAEQLMHRERRDFLFPPLLGVELGQVDSAFAGGLVGRKILLNQNFIQQMVASRDVPAEAIIQAVIDRSLNRFLRVPESFAQMLQLYAALREVILDAETARKHLEIYLALWNEMDLYAHRGKGERLVELYRASLAIPEEEQRKLPIHYLILVSVLQERWGIDLGLDPELLRGWGALARKLAQIDYLYSDDRERDIKEFGKLYSRCYIVVKEVIGPRKDENKEEKKEKEQPPVHWPLENTLDSFLSGKDIREGIAEFLKSIGDLGKALRLLEEFSAALPEVKQLLGEVALLEGSRWWWYEVLAEPYRLSIVKKPFEQTGRVYAVSLKRWDPEDGLDRLAPLASFGPLGLPGITKRWLYSGPESQLRDQQVPDLITVIDSSGSMPNASTSKSFAVLGAFVAANSYLDYGSRVAVVNFSSSDLVLEFSTDRTTIYKYLAAFQGGGTTLRVSTIEKLLEKNRRETDILLITDLGLASFEQTLQELAKHARTHRVFVLLINASSGAEEQARERLPESVEFFRVEREEDIPQLVLGAVQRSFDQVGTRAGEGEGGLN